MAAPPNRRSGGNPIDLHGLGTVTLTPSGPVEAGQVGTWRIELTVGIYGIDEGGTLKIAQRFASDWEIPQFDRPSESGFTTVSTTGNAKLAARYDPKGYIRPWMKCIVLDVYDGSLVEGDIVTVILGDPSEGSPGIRAQSFQESHHEFRVLVDPTNACLPRRVPTSPGFPIVPQAATRIVCIVPTTTVVSEPVDVFIRGEDPWGNPTPRPTGVVLRWEGNAPAHLESAADGVDQLTPSAEGQGRVLALWQDGVFASNSTIATQTRPTLSHYWGDLHAQSDATVGTGNEVEYFTFGRDNARLDFTSHQGNDFQMTDEDWERLNRTVAQFNDEGRFIVFPGFEWSANSPAGGDRNVFYLKEGHPIIRSSHWQIPDTPADGRTPAHPVDVFFQKIRENVPEEEVILAAHVGGRYAEIRKDGYFDERLGPLVEVASCWGIFEWILWDAFDRGYTVGVMCNSDGHKGRPGAEGPGAGQFGIGGGLTCVLAEDLTRMSVFRALKERRCYGTTGPRIVLWFTANGEPMGSVLNTAGPILLQARAVGAGPLEALELYRGKERIEQVQGAPPEESLSSHRIRVSWGGARIRGRGRRVTWDGTISVSDNLITSAEPYSFDSPADGIRSRSDQNITFQSRTTGDRDGVDVWVRDSNRGTLSLKTPLGSHSVDLAELTEQPLRQEFGGLDIHAQIQRYPEVVNVDELELETQVAPSESTPYFVRVVQEDGHMAWSSPIYVRRP